MFQHMMKTWVPSNFYDRSIDGLRTKLRSKFFTLSLKPWIFFALIGARFLLNNLVNLFFFFFFFKKKKKNLVLKKKKKKKINKKN